MAKAMREKVVVVTGAGSGLGAALSKVYAQAGAQVVGLDVDNAGLAKTAEQLAEAGLAFASQASLDVRDQSQCTQQIEAVIAQFGGIDVLVNNAGITHRSALRATSPEVIRRVMEVNFFGAVNCTYPALDSLCERAGKIVVLSSVAGYSPLIARTGYAASKHALHGFFESLRTELVQEQVGVLMVCPAFIDTAINQNALGGDGRKADHEQMVIGGRLAPDQVASQILQASEAGEETLILGHTAHLARWLHRLAPKFYAQGMRKRLQGEMQ